MPSLRNCMECFQKDSKIGFQFLPSDKLSPVANYSHCQLTLEPAPSQPVRATLPNLLLPVMSTTLMKTDRKALCLHINWAKYHCVIDTSFSRVYVLWYRDTLNVWLWCIIDSNWTKLKSKFFFSHSGLLIVNQQFIVLFQSLWLKLYWKRKNIL